MAQKEFVYTIKVKMEDENGEKIEKVVTRTADTFAKFDEGLGELKNKLANTAIGCQAFKDLQKEIAGAEELLEKAKIATENFDDSISGAESKIASLKSQLAGAKLGSDEFKKLTKEVKTAEQQLEKAKLKSQSFGESMAGIPGPIGQVSQGVKGLSTTFKALLANPIVLVFCNYCGSCRVIQSLYLYQRWC